MKNERKGNVVTYIMVNGTQIPVLIDPTPIPKEVLEYEKDFHKCDVIDLTDETYNPARLVALKVSALLMQDEDCLAAIELIEESDDREKAFEQIKEALWV